MAGVQQHDRSALVPQICDRLAEGTPLTVICRELGISRYTVRNWWQEDKSIADMMDEARAAGADKLAQECLTIADTPQEGEEIVIKDGRQEVHRGDMLGHRKLRVETRLKLLAKWHPKEYGEKLEHTGPNGGPIPIASVTMAAKDPVEAAAIYQKVMAGEG